MTFEHQRARSYLRGAISSALLSTLALQAQAAPSYQLSTIGSNLELPIMNANGTLAGGSQGQLAIFQNGKTQLVDLPTGTTSGYATGINDQDVVLGTAYRVAMVGNTIEHAGHQETDNLQQFLYQAGKLTNMQQIIGMPLASTTSSVTAFVSGLNNHGELVGTINHAGSAASEAFVYRDGQVQAIATPGKWSSVTAYGINNLGIVVGGYSYLNPVDDKYASGLFLDDHGKLTDLAESARGFSYVRGFNDKGQILLQNDTSTSIYENGQLTMLNVQSDANPTSFFNPKGLGGEGTVIGYSLSDTWSSVPILFAHGEKLDPNSLIDPQSAAQHHITDLLSINSQGIILAVDQAGQQVLLTPLSAVPETGSLSLMACGLALMALLRRRRKVKHTEH